MRWIICLTFFSLILMPGRVVQAQQGGFSTQQGWESTLAEQSIQTMRRYMKSSGTQVTARNLLVLQAVVNYKTGDEKYLSDFEDLENNREYKEKLRRIMSKLSNKKHKNAKNRQVLEILNDAGNKLYNLLSN